MNPIIIIEGPDGCGKTTWCKHYQATFGAKYMRLGLHKNLYAYQTMSLVRAVHWAKKVPVLIDRHWPSEQIYGSVYRGACLREEATKLEKFCEDFGVFYVIAIGSDADSMANWHRETSIQRPEMYLPDSKYREVLNGYLDWWFGKSTCAVDTGHCAKTKPMCTKFFSAIQYNRDGFKSQTGVNSHVHVTHDLATSWRNFQLSSKDSDTLTKNQLVKECGYEAPKNSNQCMA